MNSYLKSNYFEWLLDIIGGSCGYRKMLSTLFDIDYYWVVKFDDDRVKDGYLLRKTYLGFIGSDGVIEGNISVLEVMIALAISCEDTIMHDRDIGDRTPNWFWMMCSNLKITGTRFGDQHYNRFTEEEVRVIIDNMLARRYGDDGKGSMFPCVKSVPNFSNLNLWLQLNQYLLEKYEF